MCYHHKLSFIPQQPLRPYLREESQGAWSVHPAVGVPAPAISEPPAGKTQMCLDFLIPASPSSSYRKDTEGDGSDSPEYPKAASGFQVPAPSRYHQLPEKHTCDLDPLYREPQKTRAVFQVPASCFPALCTRCLTDEDQRSTFKSVQESNGRNK